MTTGRINQISIDLFWLYDDLNFEKACEEREEKTSTDRMRLIVLFLLTSQRLRGKKGLSASLS